MKHLESWLRIRKTADGIDASGDPRCQLGHKIDRGQGQTPDGIFVEWEWDGRCLQARNDRYGMFPLFYCSQGSEIMISTSLVKPAMDNLFRDSLRSTSLYIQGTNRKYLALVWMVLVPGNK